MPPRLSSADTPARKSFFANALDKVGKIGRKSTVAPDEQPACTTHEPIRRHLPVQAGTFDERRDANALSTLESESSTAVIEAGLWKYHRLLPPLEDSKRRQRFQTLLLLMLYYTCLYTPMRCSFFVLMRKGAGWRALDAIDIFIDACFWVDVALNMRTAYYDDEKDLVTEWRLIVKRYMRFWFWVEALATVPWDVITGIFEVSWRLLFASAPSPYP